MGGFTLTALVLAKKQQFTHCGFDNCHKKYKYLGNPQLLEKIFSPPIKYEKIVHVNRPKHVDPNDRMITTECTECKKEFLLVVEEPICINCRRFL